MSKFVLTAQLQLQAPTNVGQVVNQIQRQLNNVNVNIQAQGATAAEKQIKKVTSATNNAASAANRMGKAFAVSIKRFAAFSIATRAVGLLTTTLGDAISEAIDFERQLLKVSQVTGKTMNQLKDLTGEINRLSTGLGVASKSLLEVSRTLSQAGLSARDTKVALDSLAKTTLAPTFDDITQTAEGAVAVMAQFKQGAAALEKQLGAINAVAGQFAVEAGDLISVIRRTGGVFREAGGDLNELIGLFTSVRATTRESADSIATGLRTIFTRIQRPKTIEFMKQFGVELTDLNGKFVGPFEAVKRLSEALKGLEQGDIRFIKIAEQLGGFRQIGKVIPLLKEFRTAEEARQAALAGGNSLTDDAAAAQATLAVQIAKVQESFAKLVRGITETTTFQIIAKSALAFADSLIRIADAIKPLLPILAALAAFKLAKSFGQFGAGISAGIKNLGANVQGANSGGRIKHFARGGMVPGTGNSDTVPAMLQPGEFVIKKSSVKGIGASRLASMNKGGAKKYADGGPVADVILKLTPKEIGGFFLNPAGGEETNISASSKVKTMEGRKGADLLRSAASKKKFNAANPIGPDGDGLKGLSGKKLNELGLLSDAALAKGGKKQAVGRYKKLLTGTEFTKKDGTKLTSAEVKQAVRDSYTTGDLKADKGLKVQAKGEVASFLPGLSEIEEDPTVSAEVAKRTKEGLGKMVKKATADVYANVFKGEFNGGANIEATTAEAVRRIKTDDNAVNTTQGFVFEGLIEAMTGAKPGGGTTSFDFPRSSLSGKTEQLKAFFGGDTELDKLIKADAKKTLSNKNLSGIAGKVISDFSKGDTDGVAAAHNAVDNTLIKTFAKGGSVSDTVPAMLTPGEYVINKRSAQQIGYGSLSKMNKEGVQGFAKGGSVGGVQYFADAGEVQKSAPVAGEGPKLAGLRKELLDTETLFGNLNEELAEMKVDLKDVNDGLIEMNKAVLETRIETKEVQIDSNVAKQQTKGQQIDIEQRAEAEGRSGFSDSPHRKSPPQPVDPPSEAFVPENMRIREDPPSVPLGSQFSGDEAFTSDPSAIAGPSVGDLPEPPEPVIKAETIVTTAAPTGVGPDPAMFGPVTASNIGSDPKRSQATTAASGGGLDPSMFAPVDTGNQPSFEALAGGTVVPTGKPAEAMGEEALESKSMNVGANIDAFGEKLNTLNPLLDTLINTTTATTAATSEVTTGFAGVGANTDALAQDMNELASTTDYVGQSMDPVISSLKEQGKATEQAVQNLKEENKATNEVTQKKLNEADQTGKTTKAGIGAMTLFFALQSALAMIPTEIKETDGVFKRVGKAGVKLLLSLVALGFVVKQFIGETTLAARATELRTAGELKAASTTAFAAGFQAKSLYAASAAADLAASAMVTLGTAGLIGFAAIAAAGYLLFNAFRDIAKKTKEEAIESGNVIKASAAAEAEAGYAVAAVLSVLLVAAVAAAIGLQAMTFGIGFAIIGITAFIAGILDALGWLTPLVNMGRDVLAFFGLLDSTATIRLRAEADAQAANATEKLKKATEATTEAFKEVQDGARTATDALLDNAESDAALKSAGSTVNRELKAQASEAGASTDRDAIKNRRRIIGNFIEERGTEDGVTETTKTQMEQLGIDDAEVKAFKENTQRIFDLIKEEADLRARAAKEAIRSNKLMSGVRGVTQESFVAEQKERIAPGFDQLSQQQQKEIMEDLNKEYENALRATIDNIKQLQRFNFGLTETNGVIAMASAKINNLNMAFDSGSSRIRASINKLSTIIEDGASMDPAELQKNLTAINKELSNFGVDPRSVDKITKQFEALNTVQSSFRTTTEELIVSMQDGGGFGSAENFTEKLKEALTTDAVAAGADPEAVKELIGSLPDLSGDDIEALKAGDTSVLAAGFSEVNDKLKATLETMAKIAALTEEVAKLNADRLASETALFAAQKTAINLQLEGAQIQAKFGGKIVSSAVLRQSAIRKANVGTGRSGLSALQSGSVGEIRRRNQEIRGGVFGIQGRGRANVAGGGGFFGSGPKVTGAGFSSQGQATEAQGKALRQAQQEQISTIKSLIAAEEAHLKTIEEKNRLEKESLKSLLDGDVEDFLDKQAAVGATAAIASGDTRLQGIFGADALGGAFKDLEKQQAAGVTSLFGQQLSGSGGLLEQASGAALSARGVTDPRTAALLAQTTAEEEISKGNIRDLAGELGATGDVGVDIAAQDLKTAEFKVAQATIVVQKAQQEAQEKSKAGADIRAAGQARSNEILERSEKQLKLIEEHTSTLPEEQGADSFSVFDKISSILFGKANKTQEQILKETEHRNKVDQGESTQLQSGKFTGGKRKALLGAANLASISQSIVRANASQAGRFGGKLGSLGTGGSKLGGALQRGGTGFTSALKAGASFKEAIKGGFKGLSRGLGLSGKDKVLTRLSKAIQSAEFPRLKEAFRPFREGATRGRLVRGLVKAKGGVSRSPAAIKAARSLLPKSFRGQIGNLVGATKDLTKFTASKTGSFAKFLAVNPLTKGAANLTGAAAKGTQGFLGGLAGKASEATGKFGLQAIGRTNVGTAFRAGKSQFGIGQTLTKQGGARQILQTGEKTLAGVKNTAAARTANALGRSTKTIGEFSKNLASKGGKQILGEGLEVAGKAGKSVFKGLGRGIPLIGAAISAGFGAYEASQAGEDTGGIAGGALLGLLSGSAYAGDSAFTGGANLLGAGIERGGTTDRFLGVLGAGLHGALIGGGIGTAAGGPIGTIVGGITGAVLGVGTELVKIANAPPEGILDDARQVEAKLKLQSGKTDETLGLKLAEDGSALSSSLETGASGFFGLAEQRDAILASTGQGASPIIAPASVQAAGGPAVVGGGPLPAAAAGVGITGGAAGGVDQAGLMQVMNVFSQNIGNFGVEMQKFNEGLAQNIKELKDLKFKIQLDGPTNVNVNFQNAGFLSQLTEGLKNELLKIVAQEMVPNIKHDNAGNHNVGGNVI